MGTATSTRSEPDTPEVVRNGTVIRNGVNVDQLVGTIEAIKADPGLAQFQFRTRSRWENGGRSVTTVQGFHGAGQEDTSRSQPFEVASDEPPVLLGGNSAPNAVELVLTALASCLSVGFVYNAAAQGIRIEALDFELEGDVDLHGFLGLSERVRPGFRDIRLVWRVRADAPRATLEALCDYVQRTSPVLDILRNPVPVSIALAR